MGHGYLGSKLSAVREIHTVLMDVFRWHAPRSMSTNAGSMSPAGAYDERHVPISLLQIAGASLGRASMTHKQALSRKTRLVPSPPRSRVSVFSLPFFSPAPTWFAFTSHSPQLVPQIAYLS